MLTVCRSMHGIMIAALLTGVATLCAAQEEPQSIYLGGMKVITLRDKGEYASITERAAAIDKAISEVISTKDTQHPNITVKEVKGQWTVYAWDIKIVAVSAAEAAANNMPAKSLAAVWAKNLKDAFPKSTPLSKGGGASSSKPKPAAAAGSATAPVTPAPKPTSQPAVQPQPTTSGGAPNAPSSAPVIPRPNPTAIGAPTLLVRDYFNTVRSLTEEEFLTRRDELVSHLIADLTPFITGKIPAVAGAVPVGPGSETPVTPRPSGVSPAPAPVAPAPGPAATARPPRPPAAASTSAGAKVPPGKAGDPAYAKVPQKNRIRDKLERCREPYLALKQEDPQGAKPVEDLLAACRQAFAQNRFDEAEQYVDSAMERLGITP